MHKEHDYVNTHQIFPSILDEQIVCLGFFQCNSIILRMECPDDMSGDEFQDKNVSTQNIDLEFNNGIGNVSQQGLVSKCLHELEVKCIDFIKEMDTIIFNQIVAKEGSEQIYLVEQTLGSIFHKSFTHESVNLSLKGDFEYPTTDSSNSELVDPTFQTFYFKLKTDNQKEESKCSSDLEIEVVSINQDDMNDSLYGNDLVLCRSKSVVEYEKLIFQEYGALDNIIGLYCFDENEHQLEHEPIYECFLFITQNEYVNNEQTDYECFTFPIQLDEHLVEYSCK